MLLWGLTPHVPYGMGGGMGGVVSAADDTDGKAQKRKKEKTFKGRLHYEPSGGRRNKARDAYTSPLSYKGDTLTYFEGQHNEPISTDPLVFLNKKGKTWDIMVVVPSGDGKDIAAYYLFGFAGEFPGRARIRRGADGLDEEQTTEQVRNPTAATFGFFARAFGAGRNVRGYTVEFDMRAGAESSLASAMGLQQPAPADPSPSDTSDAGTTLVDLLVGLAAVSLTQARTAHAATALPDGRVFVVGGAGPDGRVASAEIWDPATGEFTPAGSLAGVNLSHTATALPDGRVLVVGGSGSDHGVLATAEVRPPLRATPNADE
jgi:hypothetical protein